MSSPLFTNWIQAAVVYRLEKIREWEQRMAELPPGLELDKLVARRIFGWRERSQDIRKAKKDKRIYDRSLWWDKDGGGPVYLNHFSTDIKAVWDLVEKFKLCIIPWDGRWTAFQQGRIFTDGERNMAPTAPHAICLAALFYAENDE